MSLKKIGQGLIFGSLLGGTLGLLFAPRSGNDTRKKWKNEVDDAISTTENLDDSLKQFQQALHHLKQTTESILPPIIDDTKEIIQAFQFQAKPRIDQINQQVDKIKEDLNEF